jgi:2-(1,2-epoxy-1,2-dihydrophenyl)acetyl-CoA isomerase
MTYQTIRAETVEGVAVLTLNRPGVMNALNAPMRAELTDAIRNAGADARVVVLTGAGRAFCAGQDLGDARDAARLDLERVLREEYLPLVTAILDCPVPVVAAVNGAAAGAGASLALAADVAIAAESAFFQQAFTKVGLIPDAGATWFLPRRVGLARAMGAALFAERIPARQAAAWGMIWECVPDEEFAAHWRARARALAEGPTLAYRQLRAALLAGATNGVAEQLDFEARAQGALAASRDFREGMVAFLEKRPPRFEGR